VRSGAINARIDVRRTAGQQNSIGTLYILGGKTTIGSRGNHQRQTAGRDDGFKVMPDLADVFRLVVVPGRNSDPGFFHI
jgi:hypothetical protein